MLCRKGIKFVTDLEMIILFRSEWIWTSSVCASEDWSEAILFDGKNLKINGRTRVYEGDGNRGYGLYQPPPGGNFKHLCAYMKLFWGYLVFISTQKAVITCYKQKLIN